MGYLDNTSVTVDAVLTKKGRELLSSGNFNITKFALGDDEIDYSLWDTSHNLGSAYYGEAIERMPILEAFTDDPQTLKYKLVTMDKNTQIMPAISVGVFSPSITMDVTDQETLQPSTLNVTGGNAASGYTVTVGNTDIVQVAVNSGGSGTTSATGNQLSASLIGQTFTITALSILTTQTTTITVSGNDTGGSATFAVTINADTTIGSPGS